MRWEDGTCEACRAGAPAADAAELASFLGAHPEWAVEERNGMPTLHRVFRFPDFAAALAFTNRVGALAEELHHHPRLATEWGRVGVRWWTHKIRNLHRNDLVAAARTDRLAGDVAPG